MAKLLFPLQWLKASCNAIKVDLPLHSLLVVNPIDSTIYFTDPGYHGLVQVSLILIYYHGHGGHDKGHMIEMLELSCNDNHRLDYGL